MLDLFGNHIVGFPTRRLNCYNDWKVSVVWKCDSQNGLSFEPPCGKTNNVVAEQV